MTWERPFPLCLWGPLSGRVPIAQIAKGGAFANFVFRGDSGVLANITLTVPFLALYHFIATDLGMKLGQDLSKIRCGALPETIFFHSMQKGDSALRQLGIRTSCFQLFVRVIDRKI